MVAAGKVDAGNLQVASIDVALVERYCAVDCLPLVRTAAHYSRFPACFCKENELKCRKSAKNDEKNPLSCAYISRKYKTPSKSLLPDSKN